MLRAAHLYHYGTWCAGLENHFRAVPAAPRYLRVYERQGAPMPPPDSQSEPVAPLCAAAPATMRRMRMRYDIELWTRKYVRMVCRTRPSTLQFTHHLPMACFCRSSSMTNTQPTGSARKGIVSAKATAARLAALW